MGSGGFHRAFMWFLWGRGGGPYGVRRSLWGQHLMWGWGEDARGGDPSRAQEPHIPSAAPHPYLGVQSAHESVQLHIQAAAADVNGGFQDLTEALESKEGTLGDRSQEGPFLSAAGWHQSRGDGGQKGDGLKPTPKLPPLGTATWRGQMGPCVDRARCWDEMFSGGVSHPFPPRGRTQPHTDLGDVEGLRVLLVEGEDGWDEFWELLLQLLAGHQVAHGSQGLHHRQTELRGIISVNEGWEDPAGCSESTESENP